MTIRTIDEIAADFRRAVAVAEKATQARLQGEKDQFTLVRAEADALQGCRKLKRELTASSLGMSSERFVQLGTDLFAVGHPVPWDDL